MQALFLCEKSTDFCSCEDGTKWNIMEQIGTFWNTLTHFGTFKEGERMTEEQTTIKEQEREQVAPSAIYQNNILALVDDLKQDNQFIGLTDEEIKNNKAFFPRLVNYIYNSYLGDLLQNKLEYKLQGIKPIYPDIKQLDDLFNIYINLVSKYKWNNRPSVLEFSILTGISRDTFYNWLNGNISDVDASKDKRKYITKEYIDTVQKWFTICEQSLVDGSGDTIKEIFILKSKYGYKEQDKEINININNKQLVSAEELPTLTQLTSNI